MGVIQCWGGDKSWLDRTFPIGSLYISVNNTNPGTLFGGTWTQIKDDAYLKIVTSKAGELAGTSSNHKIPISSIPAHTHKLTMNSNTGTSGWAIHTANETHQQSTNEFSGSTGGGQAYYPYYLGIYVWKRSS